MMATSPLIHWARPAYAVEPSRRLLLPVPVPLPRRCSVPTWQAARRPSSVSATPCLDALASFGPEPQAVLDSCTTAWPGWARNAFRLIKEGGAPVADAPSPQEAAAALKAVAKRAIKLPPAERASTLARHRVVLGLLECLRVTPPRGSPSGAFAPLQQPAAPHRGWPAGIGGHAGAAAPPRWLSAAELSGALWSLAVLGGDVHYEGEMEALAARLPGVTFDRLLQVADVCWALGTARHWSTHLPLLEQQAVLLIEAGLGAPAGPRASSIRNGSGGEDAGEGGRSSLASPQLVSSTAWGLSVLGHPPLRLLGMLPVLLQRWEQEGVGGSGVWPDPDGKPQPQHLPATAAPDAGSAGQRPRQAATTTTTTQQQQQQQRQQRQELVQHDPGKPGRRAPSPPSFPSLCTLAWSMAVAGEGPPEAWHSVLAALARSAAREPKTFALPGLEAGAGGGRALQPSGRGQQQRQKQPQRAGAGASAHGSRQQGAAGAAQGEHASKKQLMQLHQVALALGAGGDEPRWWPSVLAGEHLLPPTEADALQDLFAQAAAAAEGLAGDKHMRQVSGCQADVANTLCSLGLAIEEEHQVVRGLLVDAAVPRLMLAVEVDGPTHFTRNPAPPPGALSGSTPASSISPASADSNNALGGRPVGATLLKHRLLKRQGWLVAHVDSEAWEQLRGPEQKRAWLVAAIQAAGIEL